LITGSVAISDIDIFVELELRPIPNANRTILTI